MTLRNRIYGAMTLAIAALPGVAAQAKAPDTQQLKIDIVAKIPERCGIAANGQRANDMVRLDQPQTVTFAFTLDCNTPFRIGVATRNGGLRLLGARGDGSLTDERGFGVQKRYDVGLSFMTDQDGLVDAGRCDAARLTAASAKCNYYGAAPGDGFSPGRKTTAVRQDGRIDIAWKGESDDAVRLAAGEYQDVLTIVVGPRT